MLYVSSDRLKTVDQDAISWFARAGDGDVNVNLKNSVQNNYNLRRAHWFGNVPNRRISIHAGTTTVSVGFVDLGVLVEAELCPGIASCVSTKLSDELRKATIKAWGELLVLGDGGSTAKRSGTFLCRQIITLFFNCCPGQFSVAMMVQYIINSIARHGIMHVTVMINIKSLCS